MPPRQTKSCGIGGKYQSGFTLVEVTMALAIIAVSLLSILALLAEAMDGSREAAGRTIGSEIGARLMGEYQLMDWETFLAHEPQFRYFDEFGGELLEADAESRSSFTAFSRIETEAPDFHSGGTDTDLPCRKVVVIVADRPGPLGRERIEDYDPGQGSSRNLYLHRSVVVNLDK